MARKVKVIQQIARVMKLKAVGAQGPVGKFFDKIGFNLAAGIEVAQGEFAWNADEDTLDLGQHERVLQLGQELGYFARNGNVGLLQNGTPVMATATIGASGRIVFDKMDGTVPANAKYFLGLLTEDFDSGEDGHITSFGKVRQIDTTGALSFGGLETWADGEVLYVDPVNIGYLTNVVPSSPNLNLAIAFIINAGVAGSLHVRATALDENALGGDGGGLLPASNILTADFDLGAEHVDIGVRVNTAGTMNIDLSGVSTVPIGAIVNFFGLNVTGTVRVNPGAGATIYFGDSTITLPSQFKPILNKAFGVFSIWRMDALKWYVFGDVELET